MELRFDETSGPVLVVAGVDLMDGTPIYDVKPYLPYVDAHPEAAGGFSDVHSKDGIRVEFPEALLVKLPEELRQAAIEVLAQDPRAAYNKKPDYVYGMAFAEYDIRFTVPSRCCPVPTEQVRFVLEFRIFPGTVYEYVPLLPSFTTYI